MNLLQPAITPMAPVRVMFNVGALVDIPTGNWIEGRYGEYILNGGLGAITGVVGHGNNFKSTFAIYLQVMFLLRVNGSTTSTHDTEENVHPGRLLDLYMQNAEWDQKDPFIDGRWLITSQSSIWGGAWFDQYKEFLMSKRKLPKALQRNTAFLNHDRSGFLSIPQPTSGLMDSLSEFQTEDVVKMQDDNTLGDSGANTIFMRQGIQKNRLIQELPVLCASGYHYMILTGHIGDKFDMDPRNPSMQKLQHLRGNVKIKGIPEKFTFATNACWHAYGASILANDTTKAPQWPRNSAENEQRNSKDLNVVRLRQLRSKSGESGYDLELVVSQSQGILPTLSEFNYIYGLRRFGIDGGRDNYFLKLLPDVSLRRTTVRGLIDENPRLRRAINITSEIAQMYHFEDGFDDLLCDPGDLYTDLKALGYDWDVLLDTRGWHTLDNDSKELPHYLSTMDLLRMRQKLYVPYWMSDKDLPEAVRDVPRKKAF